MYELFILVILVAVIVWSIRGGKPRLEEPVVVRCPGKYHITLAPQLAYAQPFLEQVAGRFALSYSGRNDFPAQYFGIGEAHAQGYLLAVAMRTGVLYFQAIAPQPLHNNAGTDLEMLREFSSVVMSQLPLAEPVDTAGAELLRAAVDAEGASLNMNVKILPEA